MSLTELQRKYATAFANALHQRLGDDLWAVVLYGSAARGTAHPESDVDVLIVWQNAPATYYERLSVAIEVSAQIQSHPDAIALRAAAPYAELGFLILSDAEASQNRYVYLDMTEEAIILYEREGFFSRRLSEMRARLAELGSQRVWLPDGTWYWDLKPDLIVRPECDSATHPIKS
jgi:predicted nucleotidyltransferase